MTRSCIIWLQYG